MPRPLTRNELLIACATFSLATLVYTFPLVTAPSRANRFDSPDALLNAWIVSWNLHQLGEDPFHLFDANIFHPEKGTLAYSENLVTAAVLAAPVAAFSDNPVLLYNAVLYAAFVLTGVATFVLAYDLTGDRLASLLAGVVFAFAPYRFAHIPHLQLQLAFGIPLSLFLARRLVRGSRPVLAAIGVTLTAVATFGSSVYYAVFATSAVPIVALAELRHLARADRWRGTARLALASVLAVIVTLPLMLPYLDKLRGGTVRSLGAAAQFSAGLTEYLSSFSVVHPFLPKAAEPLFPGFVAAGLAAVALVRAPSPHGRKWCWALVGVLGVALSLGPQLGLFTFLYDVAAPFRAIRVPSRAGVLFLLAIAVLAAFGLALVRGTRLRTALFVLAAVECVAIPLPFGFEVPSAPPIYRDVVALRGPGALVELPLPPPERFQDNAIYVYRSIAHRRPMVNGYSGFIPRSYRRAHRLLMRRDLEHGLDAMRQEGVGFVLAHEGRLGPRMMRQVENARESGALVLISERSTDRLYAIADANEPRGSLLLDERVGLEKPPVIVKAR